VARTAIVLYEEAPEKEQFLLARTLDFFGVPWKMLALSAFPKANSVEQDSVVFGSASAVAIALEQTATVEQCLERRTVFYAYSSNDRSATERGIRSLLGDSGVTLGDAPDSVVPVQVSSCPDDEVRPMAGIGARVRMRKEDAILAGIERLESRVSTILSADGAPIYLRMEHKSIPIYLCASRYVTDIDQEIEAGYYDVKEHFCSTVPLVTFIRLLFQEVAWHPQELGACLIIDDPLLRRRYGCCDFKRMQQLMREYGFTTNIAFIPWNWQRTSPAAADLFGNGSGPFSVSVHGCDHIQAEFGNSSPAILYERARLALRRMRKHEERTGIHHDPIMVFPQGVFSSRCPGILKQAGFWAAINTEVSPVDRSSGRTRIRDVWDIATMKYGDFPVFTRRYAHHGIENFAFDLLLGKPCLIAAHHDFFKDECAALLRLLEELQARNCSLHWQPLGAVIRKACRRRSTGGGTEEVQLYGADLSLHNASEQPVQVFIQKQEADVEAISEILCDGAPVPWRGVDGRCSFAATIPAKSERLFRISYREPDQMGTHMRSAAFRPSVGARRFLSELRDASRGKFASISLAATTLRGARK
jgi:hypothetical protein